MKKYEVAIICDKNGEIIGCLKCKLVSESEYKELVKKTQKTLERKAREDRELKLAIENTNKTVNELAREIRVLKGEE